MEQLSQSSKYIQISLSVKHLDISIQTLYPKTVSFVKSIFEQILCTLVNLNRKGRVVYINRVEYRSRVVFSDWLLRYFGLSCVSLVKEFYVSQVHLFYERACKEDAKKTPKHLVILSVISPPVLLSLYSFCIISQCVYEMPSRYISSFVYSIQFCYICRFHS